MKAIKKILAVIVCLCVVCSCAVIAVSAAEATGSITIQNPSNSNATVAGKTFNVYKIFNATTNGNNTSYSWYEKNGETPFYNFFYGEWENSKHEIVAGVLGKQDDGNVQKAVEYLADKNSGGSNFELSQVAEKLHDYIVATGATTYIDPVKAGDTATSVNIPNLSYGYYLVYDDTTLAGSAVRSAVMLSTVNKDAIITLKANRPQILKQVEENNGTFGKGTSVNIGETITFKITTAVPSHTLYTTYKYFIEDTMADGLELIADSIKVYQGDSLLTKGTDYTLTLAQGTVDFKVDFTASMNVPGKFAIDDTLTVVYDAKVTDSIEKANQNIAKLTYSNDPTNDESIGSVSDIANVYSYQFVFTKFAQDTNGILTNVRLSGAQFNLYKVVGGSDVLVKFTTRNKTINIDGTDHNITEYVVAEDASAPGATEVLETCNEGEATITLSHLNYGGHLGDIAIFGLAEGTYKLVETKAPDGYILPNDPFVIEIVDEIGALGSVGTLNVTGSHTGSGSIVNTNGMAENILTVWAEITNKPGSALPETGGMGTTIFTVLGIVMMVGAVAFFTSRKRSSVA
ncbi:MAG: SpaH/EbpB family LPXTG-anchored major pilin [Clostridia bacterium]|nr:SpaH/EbpB family LPXTG-anchored major pilin [Clostridia bacterium]